MLAPESWDAHERNDFRTPRLLYLPIHRKSLNSSTWDILFLFSHSVMPNSLWPCGLQHTRPPCPSPTPRVYSNSSPLSPWCHPTISSSVVPFSSRLQSRPASVFPSESALHIRWPKYWSFSIKPSNEHSGFIFFRMDWLDLLKVQGTLKSLLQHHSSKASILQCSVFSVRYLVFLN